MHNMQNRNAATLADNNVVKFSKGEKIEIFSSRILITDSNENSTLELNYGLTEKFYNPGGVPSCWEVTWPISPTWSNGKSIPQLKMFELAKLVKISTSMIGHKIQQVFKDDAVKVADSYEFNSF